MASTKDIIDLIHYLDSERVRISNVIRPYTDASEIAKEGKEEIRTVNKLRGKLDNILMFRIGEIIATSEIG